VVSLRKRMYCWKCKKKVQGPEFQTKTAGWGNLISFLATRALNHLRQSPDDVANAGLAKIVRVINDIIQGLTNEVSALTSANNAAVTTYNENRGVLANSVETTRAQVAALGARLAVLNGELQGLEAAVAANTQTRQDRENDLATNIQTCADAEAAHSAFINTRNEELALIREVLEILNTDLANLRDYTEGRIVNSDINVD